MVVDNKYDFGDMVYLKTDPDQLKRIITGIHVFPGNAISYTVTQAGTESQHYEFEISAEKQIIE